MSLNTTSYEIRTVNGASQDAELLALLNQAFPVSPGASFYDDFPAWDPQFKLNTAKFGAYLKGQLIASASARLAKLKTSQGVISIGIVGCVVTSPEHRGHGLATQMALKASDWIESQGCKACVLWGSEHELYQRIGFEWIGEQVRVPLSDVRSTSPHVTVLGGWTSGIFESLKHRAGGLVIQESDRSWISAHKNVQWFWTGTRENPSAYIALGRGIDLGGIVHEWGGDLQDLSGILTQLNQAQPGFSLLLSLSQMSKFHFARTNYVSEPLCMIKIFDLNPALQKELWFWGLDGA